MNLNTVIKFWLDPQVLGAVLGCFGSLSGSKETTGHLWEGLDQRWSKEDVLATAKKLVDEATPEEGEIWPRKAAYVWHGGGLKLLPSSSSAVILVTEPRIEIDFGRVSGHQLFTVLAAVYAAVGDVEVEYHGGTTRVTDILPMGYAGLSEDEKLAAAKRAVQNQLAYALV